jgi:hypothetical protein
VIPLATAVLQQDPRDSGALSARMWMHYMGRDYVGARGELDLLLQDHAEWRGGYSFICRALKHRYVGQMAATAD